MRTYVLTDRLTYLLEYACLLIRLGDALNARHIFEELLTVSTQDTPRAKDRQSDPDMNLDMSTSELLNLWLTHCLKYLSTGELLALIESLSTQYQEPILDAFLGITQLSFGQYAEALPYLEEAYRDEGLFGGDYSACLWSLGQRDQAINILLDCLERSPHEVDLYYQIVLYLSEESRPDEAYTFYLDLITLAPDYEERPELDELVLKSIIRH